MSPAQLLDAAQAAAGYDSPTAFAREVLDVTPRAVQHWRTGAREFTGPAAQLCRAVIARPSIVKAIRVKP